MRKVIKIGMYIVDVNIIVGFCKDEESPAYAILINHPTCRVVKTFQSFSERDKECDKNMAIWMENEPKED